MKKSKTVDELMALLKELRKAQIEFNKDIDEGNNTKGSLDRLEYAQSDIYEWVEKNIKIEEDQEINNMAKRTKKISINLTEEEYDLVQWLATQERRSISELAALILMDNAQLLFNEKQPSSKWEIPSYIPRRIIDVH